MISDQYLRILIHAIYAYKLHVICNFWYYSQTIADIVETSVIITLQFIPTTLPPKKRVGLLKCGIFIY